MFGFFSGRRVRAMARVIHEMCCLSLHYQEWGRSPVKFFAGHPFLKHHEPPSDRPLDDMHRFILQHGSWSFSVMVSESEKGVCIWVDPKDPEFIGVTVRTREKGVYMVRLNPSPGMKVDRPKSGGFGRLAKKLHREFIERYGAEDETALYG